MTGLPSTPSAVLVLAWWVYTRTTTRGARKLTLDYEHIEPLDSFAFPLP